MSASMPAPCCFVTATPQCVHFFFKKNTSYVFGWFFCLADFSLCVTALPAFISVHYMHVWCPRTPEESVGFSTTRVTDGYELPGGCWGLTQVLFPKFLVLWALRSLHNVSYNAVLCCCQDFFFFMIVLTTWDLLCFIWILGFFPGRVNRIIVVLMQMAPNL